MPRKIYRKINCNICISEFKFGGKTSAGKEYILGAEHHYYKPAELIKRIWELLENDFIVDINIQAFKDKRKSYAQTNIPGSWLHIPVVIEEEE